MTVEQAIREFTRRHPAEQRKLVAVSGGRDSVALLHALHAAGHRDLVVFHLDHQLRGAESAADAAFVAHMAGELGLPLQAFSVSAKDEAAARGVSVETAGRQLRHTLIRECCAARHCDCVVMAHHAGDQAETVLFNLLRGAAGLRGMSQEALLPGSSGSIKILRPLLKVTRQDIDRYTVRHAIAYREDASNATTGPVRNRIRLELLPALSAAMERDVRPALLRAAEIAGAEDEFLHTLAAEHAAAETLRAREIAALHPALQRRILHQWLLHRGLTGIGFAEVESVRAMLAPHPSPAKVNLPGNRFIRRRQGIISVEHSAA